MTELEVKIISEINEIDIMCDKAKAVINCLLDTYETADNQQPQITALKTSAINSPEGTPEKNTFNFVCGYNEIMQFIRIAFDYLCDITITSRRGLLHDHKTVLAPPKDIEEVKNAYEIYENMDLLNPYGVDDLLKAHGVMMRGLVEGCGEFRTKPVGVADSRTGEIIHVGTLPDYVPEMVCQLLNWTEESNVHMLIKSCVFHYEFEVIHPFSDGNGRTGRLWHTLLLSKWKSIFAWLPIESMIFKRQAEYYKVINRCNYNADSTEFIEFMLETIKMTLEETILTCAEGTSQKQVEEQVDFDKLLEFCKTPRTRAEMQKFCKIEGRKKFSEKYLKPLLEQGKLAMTIPEKPQSRNQKYYKVLL